MKKLMSVIMLVLLILSLWACSGGKTDGVTVPFVESKYIHRKIFLWRLAQLQRNLKQGGVVVLLLKYIMPVMMCPQNIRIGRSGIMLTK